MHDECGQWAAAQAAAPFAPPLQYADAPNNKELEEVNASEMDQKQLDDTSCTADDDGGGAAMQRAFCTADLNDGIFLGTCDKPRKVSKLDQNQNLDSVESSDSSKAKNAFLSKGPLLHGSLLLHDVGDVSPVAVSNVNSPPCSATFLKTEPPFFGSIQDFAPLVSQNLFLSFELFYCIVISTR